MSRSTQRRAAKRRWFDLGARAVAALRPDLPPGYVCPLCTALFAEADIDQLTVEHVPPKALGGQPMVLTCKACNSGAGAQADAHARRREDRIDFAQATMERDAAATLTIAGSQANVRVIATADGWRIVGEPRHNEPAAQARWEAALEAHLGAEPMSISLRRKFDPVRASASTLRAAYLTAFAVFGYAYAMHPRLDPVRAQIATPNDQIVGINALVEPSAEPSERKFMIVGAPLQYQSVLVTIGRHKIFLPSVWSDVDMYEALAKGAAEGTRFTADLAGKVADRWPEGPMHMLDFEGNWPSQAPRAGARASSYRP